MLNITRLMTIAISVASLGTAAHADGEGSGIINNPLVDAAKVAGRTYCVVTTALMNWPIPGFELRSSIARRMTTFHEGGTFSTVFLSSNANTYLPDGSVSSSIGPGSDGMGAYVQTGTRLDLVLSSGLLATWYASKDGSTLHGTRIRNFTAQNGQQLAQTITWTAVESDSCAAELP